MRNCGHLGANMGSLSAYKADLRDQSGEDMVTDACEVRRVSVWKWLQRVSREAVG